MGFGAIQQNPSLDSAVASIVHSIVPSKTLCSHVS